MIKEENMNFGIQILLWVGIALAVGISIYYYAKKCWNIDKSKNIDYFILFIIFIMVTISWIPYLINIDVKYYMKFKQLFFMYVVCFILWYIKRLSKRGRSS